MSFPGLTYKTSSRRRRKSITKRSDRSSCLLSKSRKPTHVPDPEATRRHGDDGSVIQYHNLNPLLSALAVVYFPCSARFPVEFSLSFFALAGLLPAQIPFVVGYFFMSEIGSYFGDDVIARASLTGHCLRGMMMKSASATWAPSPVTDAPMFCRH